ncbi:peptidase M50 [Thermoproteus sp. CP80]|uniref:peptidase M50 n=1 Tax=Thermoproteus sp. CP80 TaxID=1650659 RepID=UPI0009BCC66A|nr:peptidase M50 [Thermoproteus sp. CP80]PLC67322.1 peptidase M50 [Thermoproteus sp. CP80]
MGWPYRPYRSSEAVDFLLAIASVAVAYLLNFNNPIAGILLPTTAVAIAIVPHELAHRQIARRRGCWSRFALYRPGFLVTLIVNGLVGIFARGPVLFISGYTLISCYSYTREDDGLISLAGPATNMAVALLSLALLSLPVELGLLTAQFLIYLMRLNSFVAFFNLLPLGPLDGAKIFRWNIPIWAVMFLAAIYLSFII